jgi:hypothetical protein
MPADQLANAQFARTLLQLRYYSLTEKIRRVHSLQDGEKRANQIQTVSPPPALHPRRDRYAPRALREWSACCENWNRSCVAYTTGITVFRESPSHAVTWEREEQEGSARRGKYRVIQGRLRSNC